MMLKKKEKNNKSSLEKFQAILFLKYIANKISYYLLTLKLIDDRIQIEEQIKRKNKDYGRKTNTSCRCK